MDRRRLLLSAAGAVAALVAPAFAKPAAPLAIKVYKDPSCGCCEAWVEHLKTAGFATTVEERDDLTELKERLGVPNDLASCHTGVINGYAIEGHVPAADIKRLVKMRAKGKGLAVPGMPVNSPGMEMAGAPNQRYTVWLFQKNGKRRAFAKHGA